MTLSKENLKDPKFARVLDLRKICQGKKIILMGDPHGCYDEVRQLLFDCAGSSRAEEVVLIFVGDLTDRGPKIWDLVSFAMMSKDVYTVMGNHEYKLLRYLWKRPVNTTSLQRTLASMPEGELPRVQTWLEGLPHIIRFRENSYVVHAGVDPAYPVDKQLSKVCLMQRTYGGTGFADEKAAPWPLAYERMRGKVGDPMIYYGHIVQEAPALTPHTAGIDTGCVFGGKLTAIVLPADPTLPEEIFSVPAGKIYYERYSLDKEIQTCPTSKAIDPG